MPKGDQPTKTAEEQVEDTTFSGSVSGALRAAASALTQRAAGKTALAPVTSQDTSISAEAASVEGHEAVRPAESLDFSAGESGSDDATPDGFRPMFKASLQILRPRYEQQGGNQTVTTTSLQQGPGVNVSTAFNNVRSNWNQTSVDLNILTSVTPMSWNQPPAKAEAIAGKGIPTEGSSALPEVSWMPVRQNSSFIGSNPESKPEFGPSQLNAEIFKATVEAAPSGPHAAFDAGKAVPHAPAISQSDVAANPTPAAAQPAIAGAELPSDLLLQVLEHGKLLRTRTLDEVILQLKPEYLGKVTIKTTLENGQLLTRISVESSQVAQFLNENAGWLRSSLGQVDIQVHRVEYGDGSMPSSTYDQGGSEPHQDPSSHRGTASRRSASGQRVIDPEPEETVASIPSSKRLDVHL